jgi:hypothetical protein
VSPSPNDGGPGTESGATTTPADQQADTENRTAPEGLDDEYRRARKMVMGNLIDSALIADTFVKTDKARASRDTIDAEFEVIENDPGCSDTREYLDACHGTTEGTLHVGIGHGGHMTEGGKYTHDSWKETRYAWPDDADRAVQDILAAAPESDVYVGANVTRGERRAKGEAVAIMSVHADVDGGLVDVEKVRTLRGSAVASGSPGNGQVYVTLTEPVTSAQHEKLCRGLGKYLGAIDSKISDNDVLRPPGTINHKPGAGPVHWLVPPSESIRRTPGDLARQLKVTLPGAEVNPKAANGKAHAASVPADSELVDLTAYPAVQAALDNVTGDRSAGTYGVLGACLDAGLMFEQAQQVVFSRPDLVERLAGRKDDDLMRSWIKLVDKQQRRQFSGDPGSDAKPATNGTVKTAPVDMPKVWRATDLAAAAQPRWLANNRLPYAAVTLLIGDEGIGKSLLWVWIIAAVTNGTALLAFGIPARAPQLVVIVVTEDDWQTTVLPRMIAAGVNLDMVRVICTDKDGTGSPVFPRDLHLLVDADKEVGLLVVDAWLDTVSAGLSVRDPQQARLALHPFKELASRTGCAVLLLCHTNRVDSANPRDRYGATGELRKKARMTLYAQLDQEGLLTVGPEKMNTAAPIAASTFTITAVQHFNATDEHDGTVPVLTYVGESTLTAREHIAEAHAANREPDSGADVLVWLATQLAAGPRWAAEIYTAGEEAGHGKDKIKRAKLRLNTAVVKDGVTSRWFWHLPQHQGSTPSPYVAPLLPCSLAPQSENQGSASTSEETKRVHAEIRRSLTSGGDQGRAAFDVYGDMCQCGRFLARHDTGLCEWCTAATKEEGS